MLRVVWGKGGGSDGVYLGAGEGRNFKMKRHCLQRGCLQQVGFLLALLCHCPSTWKVFLLSSCTKQLHFCVVAGRAF